MTDKVRQSILQPGTATHRQDEAARARLIEGEPLDAVAARFGYTSGGLANLCTRVRRDPTAF